MLSSYLVKHFFIRYWKFPRNSGIVKALFLCACLVYNNLVHVLRTGDNLLRDPSIWQTSTRKSYNPLPILTTPISSSNIAVLLWLLTWKTVTRAQNRSSKFARAAVFTPSSSGNIYLPPKRFIPRILAVNMKSINRARNVITLSIVWIITSSCRLSAGRKRTNLNMAVNGMTAILRYCCHLHQIVPQCCKSLKKMNVSPHISSI